MITISEFSGGKGSSKMITIDYMGRGILKNKRKSDCRISGQPLMSMLFVEDPWLHWVRSSLSYVIFWQKYYMGPKNFFSVFVVVYFRFFMKPELVVKVKCNKETWNATDCDERHPNKYKYLTINKSVNSTWTVPIFISSWKKKVTSFNSFVSLIRLYHKHEHGTTDEESYTQIR